MVKVSLGLSQMPFTIETKSSELFICGCLRRFPLGLDLGLSPGTDNLLARLLGQGLAMYLT